MSSSLQSLLRPPPLRPCTPPNAAITLTMGHDLQAIVCAAIFEFAGAVLLGGGVAQVRVHHCAVHSLPHVMGSQQLLLLDRQQPCLLCSLRLRMRLLLFCCRLRVLVMTAGHVPSS